MIVFCSGLLDRIADLAIDLIHARVVAMLMVLGTMAIQTVLVPSHTQLPMPATAVLLLQAEAPNPPINVGFILRGIPVAVLYAKLQANIDGFIMAALPIQAQIIHLVIQPAVRIAVART